MAPTSKANDLPRILAFVLEQHFVGRDIRWMELRDRLEYAIGHWPEGADTRGRSAREAATRSMRRLQTAFVARPSPRCVMVGGHPPLVRFGGSRIELRNVHRAVFNRPDDPDDGILKEDPEKGLPADAARGDWWVDQRWIDRTQGALDSIDPRKMLYPNRREAIRDTLRERAAVSLDWSTMSRLWKLEVPSGVAIIALVGRARSQPVWSRELALFHEPGRYFPGGLEQYYIPWFDPKAGCRVTRVY